jgi:hypothetical protein
MTNSIVTASIVRSLMAALRAEGWTIIPPTRVPVKDGTEFWTAEEVEIVRASWSNKNIPTAEICGRVGRSINGVKHMAARIGVKRSLGRPANNPIGKPVDLGPPQDQRFARSIEPKVIQPIAPTIAAQTEVIAASVEPHDHAPKLADREPIPAPRKGMRGGVDRTGELMGDPGHGNRREAESQYSKGGSALS